MWKVLSAATFTIAAALFLFLPVASSQKQRERITVGPIPDGGFLLNSGWVLRPAGKQVPMDTFPMASVLSANGKWLLVLHGGYNPPTLSVLDAASLEERTKLPLPDAWLGLTLAPGGKTVYVSGGSRAAVYEIPFDDTVGQFGPMRTFATVAETERKHTDFIGDVTITPDGRMVYAAALYRNAVLVINPQSGRVIETFPTGRRPYRILFHPDGKSYFVSHWADASIGHYERETGRRIETLRTGPHPTDMLWRDGKAEADLEAEKEKEGQRGEARFKARLFVTNGNSNTVSVIGVSETNQFSNLETLNVSLFPRAPVGMTPSALALSPDKNMLYIVCSDANVVAVADIRGERTKVEGFVPVGWYPIAARVLPDGRLLAFNGRGGQSFPNPQGPNPSRRAAPVHLGNKAVQYGPAMQRGSISVLTAKELENLDGLSKIARENAPPRLSDERFAALALNNLSGLFPANANDPSGPIQHVIYIIKENRTYDQVLGDMPQGNGDPTLTLFPENVSPNHHKLAREFALLDNFYVSADVSADGHNWSMAGIAPDYVQRMWQNSYAGRRKHYDYEGGEPAALPPAGFIWNNVMSAGLPLRNYGYFVTNKPVAEATEASQVAQVRDQALIRATHMGYRGFDLDYLDINRAKVFLNDLVRMEGENRFPRFTILRLGNDHTSGAGAGKLSALSQMADNDAAFGMIVEGLSHSKFWPKMAIFVLEDDAQNGPDHVDSHRSPAYVISPFTKRGIVDSTFYNTTSMLRTMELLLGLKPMTMFDAGSNVMSNLFTLAPDLKAYDAEKPRYRLDERNPAEGALAARTARMNFTEADEIDDDEMNEILWRAIKKTDPPAPVRSYFGRD